MWYNNGIHEKRGGFTTQDIATQTKREHTASPFETEPIGKLLLKFAVPSIVSMLVTSLYNIVDQIFIGQGVGYLGNAATNVAFPFVTISMAFGLLIGDGCAANFSLQLGKKNPKIAQKCVGNAITASAFLSVLFALFGFIFTTPMLMFFGATENSLPFAQDYIRIILIGLPFSMVGIGTGTAIRADGSPRYAMFAMLTGAVLNLILDPLFIFVFEWGVKGAAFATILGQIATLILSLCYLPHFKNVKLERQDFIPDFCVLKRICALGISSFITQLAMTVVVVTMNNVLNKFGALSKYGTDIPLAAHGIVMKVNQIMMSVLIGISIGSQPIVGYNYGAQNFDRVKMTYQLSVLIATCWATLGFLTFQLFPQSIINIFGEEDALYNEFAIRCFRLFLMAIFLNGFQVVSSIFFQAIGKPIKATALSLSRQLFFFIPALLLYANLFGVEGSLYAGPTADFLAFLLAAILIACEMRQLNRQ